MTLLSFSSLHSLCLASSPLQVKSPLSALNSFFIHKGPYLSSINLDQRNSSTFCEGEWGDEDRLVKQTQGWVLGSKQRGVVEDTDELDIDDDKKDWDDRWRQGRGTGRNWTIMVHLHNGQPGLIKEEQRQWQSAEYHMRSTTSFPLLFILPLLSIFAPIPLILPLLTFPQSVYRIREIKGTSKSLHPFPPHIHYL